MKNKAVIWVSAIMYIGLGIAILAIILAAGMPVINKMRDKNTALQTKDLMLKMDNTIREVLEGPGSQRKLTIQINKGDFIIYSDSSDLKNKVIWSIRTIALLSEPGKPYREGNLEIRTEKTKVSGEYQTNFSLDYNDLIKISMKNKVQKISGKYSLVVMNEGVLDNDNVQTVSIREV